MKKSEWIKLYGIYMLCEGFELMDHEFPWEDVEACMANEIESPIERIMICPNCGKKLQWIRFSSPTWTWANLCGQEGPLAICKNCHKQLCFRCEIWN